MSKNKFDRPIAVFVGLGFPREIESVLGAFQLLNEWAGRRGRVHQVALDACRAALGGEDVESARQAFLEFAHDRDILAPHALARTADKFYQEWMQGVAASDAQVVASA